MRVRLPFLIGVLILLAACSTDPKKYVDKGNKYFQNGKYKEASIMYRRALHQNMRYADAWYRLGLTNMKLAGGGASLYGEARRDFMRASEIDPNNTDALVQLGDLNMVMYVLDPQGNKPLLSDLKDLSQQLLKKDPKSFDGLRFAGYIALMQKDLKTAIQQFEEANRSKPDQADMLLSLVQTLFADQRNEEGEKYARDLIAKQKTYGPMYDVLYVHYLRLNHPDQAEQLLKEKIANNSSLAPYQLQLASHYYMMNRKDEMRSTLQNLTSHLKTYPDAHMQVGDFYLKIRDFDDALQQFDQGQKDDPKNSRNYQKKMVEVLGTQRKTDQASKIVAGLLKDDPKDPEVIAMHASLLLQGGDPKQLRKAISELQPLVAKLPGNATLHYNLGRAYLGVGDPQSMDQAKLQFQEALKLEPRYILARLALAELYLRLQDNSKAVQTADEILKVDPTHPGARLVRSTGLIGMGEYGKARDELTALLKAFPKANDARYELGTLDLMQRRLKEAEEDFQALMDAGDPRGLPGVMEARIQQGHPEQAIQWAEEQLKKSPDRDDYRYALAKTYFRARRFQDAEAQYKILLEKSPKSADIYLRIGECRNNARDFNGAIEAFKKARELDPSNFVPSLDMALTYDSFLGRYDEARKAYEEVIKLQPDNVEALNNLAYLKADDGVDLDQALAYAQRAQQKRPDDPNVADTLALIFIKKNLTDDGLRMLRELVSKRPDSPTFHLHLALALYQKGDRPLAKKELEAAMRNKPSEKEQGKIKELLAKVG